MIRRDRVIRMLIAIIGGELGYYFATMFLHQ